MAWIPWAFALLLLAGCSDPEPGPPTYPTVTAHEEGTPRFEPAIIDVEVGGTVLFKVASGRHTVDFQEAVGLSGTRSGNLTAQLPYGVKFSREGTFHYGCAFHDGMVGQVNVVAA